MNRQPINELWNKEFVDSMGESSILKDHDRDLMGAIWVCWWYIFCDLFFVVANFDWEPNWKMNATFMYNMSGLHYKISRCEAGVGWEQWMLVIRIVGNLDEDERTVCWCLCREIWNMTTIWPTQQLYETISYIYNAFDVGKKKTGDYDSLTVFI